MTKAAEMTFFREHKYPHCICKPKIPLNPPLKKGDLPILPPFLKEGRGGFSDFPPEKYFWTNKNINSKLRTQIRE